MAITLDGTTGITTPASTVGGSAVLTTASSLASANLTGTVASGRMPAGSVLQVVSAALSGNNTTTSATFVTTGQFATITPTRDTSKIFIIVNASGHFNYNDAHYTIYRGATNLGGGTSPAMLINNAADWGTVAMNYLDSPATISPTTYTVYFKISGGTAYFNNVGSSGSITLMEIAG
jgi:hypothetical protein